jgi:hypothetical protein
VAPPATTKGVPGRPRFARGPENAGFAKWGRLDPESVAESVTLAAQSTITVTRRVAIAMFDPDANAFRLKVRRAPFRRLG